MYDAAALSVAGLETRYGNRKVLRGLSLEVPAGQIYGLLGPNGAGKTTLIRSICGRVVPIAGSINIAGLPNTNRAALRRIGLAPQEIALYPHLTIRENLSTFGRLSGLSRNDTIAAIDWVADAARLAKRIDERVEILSGGWKRRVNIAAAVLHRPALLILDEPTVGIDVDVRNELHELITDLSHTGIGVLLTTHDMDQAEILCKRVGFLRNGQLSLQGDPHELIEATFRGQRELIVVLRGSASPRQGSLLRSWGLEGGAGGQSWSRLGDYSNVDPEEITAEFERAGLAVRELRMRQPGLDSLFIQLNRQDLRSSSRSAA